MLDRITVYVMVVIFFATLIRSALGFGEALVAVPLLALRTPIAIAAPLAVLVSIVVAGLIVLQDWRTVQFRSARLLILASLFGIPLGIFLLLKANDHIVRLILGLVVTAFSFYSLVGRKKLHLRCDHTGWMMGCGFLAGVLGGAYGMNGPPLAVYGALRRWSPQQFRATLQCYFLPTSLIGFIAYLWIGLWNPAITRYFLLSLPGVALATLLGRSINHRLKGDGFFQIVYVGLLAIGATLILQAAGA